MAYTIRKGTMADVPAVAAVYDALLQYEGEHGTATGWQAGVYPTAAVAEGAAVQGTLFVLEEDGAVGAAMILNQVQAPEYAAASWLYDALPEQVLVLHTLCIAPRVARRGYGRAMVQYAEDWAVGTGCAVMRLDTWRHNRPARQNGDIEGQPHRQEGQNQGEGHQAAIGADIAKNAPQGPGVAPCFPLV